MHKFPLSASLISSKPVQRRRSYFLQRWRRRQQRDRLIRQSSCSSSSSSSCPFLFSFFPCCQLLFTFYFLPFLSSTPPLCPRGNIYSNCIFQRYLPPKCIPDEVFAHFVSCGPIVGGARLMYNNATGNVIRGFITFETEEGFQNALVRNPLTFTRSLFPYLYPSSTTLAMLLLNVV